MVVDFDAARMVQLWMAVILQACRDAEFNSTANNAQLFKENAISWLTNDSADFRQVCSLAGVDSDFIRDRARVKYGSG